MGWRSLLLYDLFLLAVLILATRLATFLHESIGHAITALAFGGHVSGIQVSLFGGGHVTYHLSAESGFCSKFLSAFGGILVNMCSGFLSLFFVHRIPRRLGWSLFLCIFSAVSLLGAIAYAALGFYYTEGDPVAWTEVPSQYSSWFWIPFIVLSPFVSYLAMKAYASLTESWWPTKNYLGRVGTVVLTLGIVGCSYAGLYALTAQRSAAWEAPLLAYQRSEREVRTNKIRELSRRLYESHPELSDAEIQELVAQTPIVVQRDEVPKKFPLKLVIAILYTAGALMALWQVRAGVSSSYMPITPRPTILALALAGVVLTLLVWTGGWVYPLGKGIP